MAHPKYRHSKARTRKKRAHYKAEESTFMICPKCGSAVLYHRVCMECGYYRGKLVFEKKEK